MTAEKDHNCRDDQKIIADIEIYGVSVIILDATDYLPSFAYSIGLWRKFKHPEIICFGLSTNTLGGLINDVANLVKNGQTIETNRNYDDFFENGLVQFIPVDKRNLSDYFGTAIDIYNTDNFPALQFVWTDRNNKFPWEKDFEEEFIYRQPLLDRNADFKFREAKNLATFTTKQWIELNKPIIHVIHDSDGDWQFLTDDEYSIESIKIVALEQIILKDKTLNEVFDLEYGEQAERKFIGDKWIRTKFEYADEEPENGND
ncbi:MAG TPA: DUF4262 domain-containing protein [Chitinophagaceae bacterium]|nr:DUF4262 domain-containing protein [Chitinophagaceae bacterium]